MDGSQAPSKPSFRGFHLESASTGLPVINTMPPHDDKVRSVLFDVLTDHMEYDTVEDFASRFPVTVLGDHAVAVVARLRTELETSETDEERQAWTALIVIIEEDKAHRERAFQSRLNQGRVEMRDLPLLFPVGSELVLHGPQPVAGRVRNIQIEQSFFGPRISIQLAVIHAMNGRPQQGIYQARFDGFTHVRPIVDLPFSTPTPEQKEALVSRGRRMVEMCKPGTYLRYQGSLVQPCPWSPREFNAVGRVAVDPISFRRLDPELWQRVARASGVNLHQSEETEAGEAGHMDVSADYWRCLPYLYGFSFVAKQWGRLTVKDLDAIEWRQDAFSQVVLPEADKVMVRSLVEHHGVGFQDFIAGKGGGCIFLLHGRPGEGKTLLAEATAELLEKPLYAVSVGELGTDPDLLEHRLRSVLDVAIAWKAVVLLDEADIFLEQRDEQNIARNAMVGVFLRLLEYHNGVLFLTTNRVRRIDQAFYSRISVALRFEDGDQEKREKIWQNLLAQSSGAGQWAQELATYAINGRQMKNALRTGETLARAGNRKLELADIRRAVDMALRFEEQMRDLDKTVPPPA